MPLELTALGALPVTRVVRGAGRPAVVIVPSIYGVATDLEAQMLELEGANVYAMDPFFRVRPGPIPYDDSAAAIARMRETDMAQVEADFRALIAHARAAGDGRVIGVGVCFGAPFGLRAAADGALAGLVTWHGSRMDQHLARAAEMRCPMRFHCGDSDAVAPMTVVDALREAFAGRSDVEIVVHAGAGHGFSHRDAAAYRADAERAGLDAVRALL